MVKTILFDVYGTLISTGNGSVQAAEKILSRHGRKDLSAKDFYARWKQYHREHIHRLTVFQPEEEIFRMDLAALYREYGLKGDPRTDVQPMLDTLGKRTAFPEAGPVLEALAKQHTLCIASTTDTAPLLEDLQRSGLTVHHIFTSESLQAYKPQPAFYRAILQELKVEAQEALFVGDSLTDDVMGPQRVGIPACWVNRKSAALPDGLVPDYMIHELTELLQLKFER